MDVADLTLIRASNKANNAFAILLYLLYVDLGVSGLCSCRRHVDTLGKKYHLMRTSRLETPRLCSFGRVTGFVVSFRRLWRPFGLSRRGGPTLN